MPTIFDPEESHLSAESKYLKSPISVPRKSPTKRVYQQDQFKLFEEQDIIKSFDDIDSKGYTFQKYDDHVVFYHLETNVLNVPEVTDCMPVDRDLHFVIQGLTFTFTTVVSSRKGLSLYEKKYDAKLPKLYQIRGRADVQYSGRAQIQEKKNILVQCYSIFTSSTLYFLKNIPIINKRVSISFLVSTEKKSDVVKCAKSLKSQGVISEDVVLMFDEMYLQKCEEYCGGEIIGANENNELYKGLLSFMIVELKENFFYIVKSIPERNIMVNG